MDSQKNQSQQEKQPKIHTTSDKAAIAYFAIKNDLNVIGGYDTYIKPKLIAQIEEYQNLLVEATLSSTPIETIDLQTNSKTTVTPLEAAARIRGFQFVVVTLDRILKKGREKYEPEVLEGK